MEKLKLGKHKLRVPAICASVIGDDVDAMAAGIARAIGQEADIVELRLDGLHKQVGWEKLLKTKLPLILTNRAEREGGRFRGEESARVNQLLKGIAEGAACIDIELSTSKPLLNEVVKAAKTHGTSLLMTHHDFKKTPPISTLTNIAKRMADAGCDIIKIVTFARTSQDVLTVLDFLTQVQDSVEVPVISFAMGEVGMISRIAAPFFGSPIVYAAADEITAPGQFDIETARRLLCEFGLRG
jgi:3-dehydroquinate dehydratase-1